MRYPSLKNKIAQKYSVTAFNEGILQTENSSSNSLSKCENVYNLDGRLASRQGFIPVGQYYIASEDKYITQQLRTTETIYNIDGKNYRLAYMISSDYISCDCVNVYLAGDETGYKSIGQITFRRTTSSQFYRPSNIYFIVANPTSGSGIYAFVTRNSLDDEIYDIYEADTTLTDWMNITYKAYVPTIYANGRGTQFATSQEFDDRLDYPSPVEPEQRNLLTGCFRAYFSSDRVSYMFKLPLSNLDNNVITCKVYTSAENYTSWMLDINQSVSTSNFNGEQITFCCNRKTGYFWFLKGQYSYTIPVSEECPFNNIVITAHKSITNGGKLIIGSKNAVTYNSGIYVYGNRQNPNVVYSAQLTNPLYFPENAKAIVGEGTNEVVALGVQSGKLIAFKAGETHKINVSKNSAKVYDAPIFDIETDFGREDILESQVIHTSIGCDCPNTLRLCGNHFIWLNSNGTVYTLATTTYGKQNNIYEISSPIGEMLKSLPFEIKRNAFAIDNNGYYVLMCGSRAFVMNYRVNALGYYSAYPKNENKADSVAWYIWQLPQEATYNSGFYSRGNLFINAADPQKNICYVLAMQGSKDRLLLFGKQGVEEKEYSVNCAFSTQKFDFDLPQHNKYINAIYITANSNDSVEITVEGDSASSFKRIRLPKMVGTVRITPLIPSTAAVKVSVKSEGEVSLYAIRFEYTSCSKVR